MTPIPTQNPKPSPSSSGDSTSSVDLEAAGRDGGSVRGATSVRVVLVLGAVALVLLAGRQAAGWITDFARWVEGLGPWGPVVFALGYAVATVAFVPGSLLTLASGALFGLGWGVLVVMFGATLGASGSFLVARYLARDVVERRLRGNTKFERIDAAVGRQGLRIVTLLRLSPAFPFNLLNVGLGLTKVRFVHFLAGCAGMLPGTFLYVFYGKAVGDLAALASGARPDQGAERWGILGLGLAATLAVTWTVTRIARRALQAEVE